MRPSARIQAVIEILEGLGHTNQPVDRYLRDWGRTHRFAGSKDRASIGERVFTIFRRRASFAWRMQNESPRALVIASLLHENFDEPALENIFDGENYSPPKLTEEERAAILLLPAKETPPLYVQAEFPQWLQGELTERFGANLLPEMKALSERAPVDLRVNTLKITRDALLYQLRNDYEGAAATPYSPFGVRIPQAESSAALGKSEAFENGLFEFQDEAAQIASVLCATKPGMRVLDLAAGAGGKSLALAALMHNKGEILATDIRSDALERLETRATRAGAGIIRAAPDPGTQSFDLVLLDAPCSGSGTWRRQPELKWRLTPQKLTEYAQIQGELLDKAARHVRPGGRLVYATCSLLAAENEGRVSAFLNPQFSVISASTIWRDITGQNLPPGMDEFFRASPYSTGTDGFFAGVLTRNG